MPIHRRLSPSAPLVAASACAVLLSGAVVAGETGVATWYGTHHEGRRTSSGAVFHPENMTAASSRLPLGSKVRVTLRETGDSVVVLVNDRMGGRALIDLSRGAAKQIGLYARGRGVVSVAPTDEEPVEVAEAEDADSASAVPRRRRHIHATDMMLTRPLPHPRGSRHAL